MEILKIGYQWYAIGKSFHNGYVRMEYQGYTRKEAIQKFRDLLKSARPEHLGAHIFTPRPYSA